MENAEEIIKKIMEEKELSEDELTCLVKKKHEEYGGLLTDTGAAYAVAKDLGMEFDSKEAAEKLEVKDLKANLDSVTVQGVVSHVFPVRNWEKEKRKGKVGSFLLKDKSGEMRVVLWNSDCDIIEKGKLQKGTIVEVQDGYIKEVNNMLDLNLGGRGRIVIKEKADMDLPAIESTTVKISDLKEGLNDVDCYVRVKRIFPINEFQREKGAGKVANVVVTDGTETRLVLWDSNTKWVEELDEADVIKVEGAYVKKNQDRLELHLGWRGRLIRNPEGAPELPSVQSRNDRVTLATIKDGDNFKEVKANIVKVYPPTLFEACVKCGKKAEGTCAACGAETAMQLIENAEIDDGTAVVRAVFFRDQAEKLLGFNGEEYKKNNTLFVESELLGKEQIFQGQVKHNSVMERIEFVVRGFKDVNVQKEIENLGSI